MPMDTPSGAAVEIDDWQRHFFGLRNFFVNYLAPFDPVPNSLVNKIANGGVDIAYNHKTYRYFYLSGKEIDRREIQDQNEQAVA